MSGYKDPPKHSQFKPGESGNPEGRPPGIQNWSSLVREVLGDTKLADKMVKKKPGWWKDLPEQNAGYAIIFAMAVQALGGDVKAFTALRKLGYGDKIDIVSNGKKVKSVAIFDMRSARHMQLAPIIDKPKPKRKKAAAKKKPSKPKVGFNQPTKTKKAK